MDDYVDYDRPVGPYRSSSGSAAAALMIVLVLGLLILFAVMAMAASTSTGSGVNTVAAPLPVAAQNSDAGADETIAFQALLSQAQTDEQVARQEADSLQTQLQATQTELQQTQQRLQQAEARANEMQTQVAALQQQIEQERMWLPIALGVLAVIGLIVALRMVTIRQNNKQRGTERERRIQWEMTRMRVMYHDALEKAQQQLDLMRHQLTQVRSAASRPRQSSRNRTTLGE